MKNPRRAARMPDERTLTSHGVAAGDGAAGGELGYQIDPADAKSLMGVVLLPADFRLLALRKMAEERSADDMLALFAQVIGMANTVAQNCREMVELLLVTHGDYHPYEAEKANLPTLYGALQGVLLAAQVPQDQKGMCHGCAYRLGSSANTSPITTSDALWQQKNLDQFFCHEDLDDQDCPTKRCVGHAVAAKTAGECS